MAMLYELHNQGQDKFVYTCNSCKSHVETRYHCTVCDDFDLCIQCNEKERHPHKMTNRERAALVSSARCSSMSSQFAAITAASARDDDSPPASEGGMSMSMEDMQPGMDQSLRKCIYKQDELKEKLMPTLEKLYRQDPESHQFRQPVDPQTLGIPDYFDIVRKPMDLSTIKKKLDLGQYSDPWEYVDDVWLMLDNAWLYNRKTTRVYRYCTKLSEVFEQEIDPVMQTMGYCCGRKYTSNPQVLWCFGKQLCTIPRGGKYHSYQNSRAPAD